MLVEVHEVSRSKRHETIAVVGLFVMSLALRPGIVSVGPLLHYIRSEFGMTHAQAALLTAIPDLCMGFFAIFVPRIAQRYGSDRAVLLSIALLGAGIAARAVAGSMAGLLLSTLGVGIGIAISGTLIGGWIKHHFPHKAAYFMGIYAAGLGIGATMAAVASEYLAFSEHGWRLAAGIWSVLCLLAIASWWRLAAMYPSADAGRRARMPAPERPVLRSPRAWLIAAYFGLSQFVVYACFAWVGESSRELKINALSPGLNLGLFAAVLSVGSLLAGVISRRSTERRGWLAWSALLTLGGTMVLFLAPGLFAAAPVMAIAFGQGMCFALAMTLPLDNTRSYVDAGRWTAFMLFVGYLVAALGPYAFGFLRDRTGAFAASYGLLVAVSLALLLLTPLLGARRPAA